MKRNLVSLLSIILMFILIFSTSSYASMNKKIEDTKNRIDDIKEEKEDVLDEVKQINDSINANEKEVNSLETQVNELTSKIDEKTQEIQQKTTDIADKEELLKKRLVALYEQGDVSFWDLLVNSKSITQFLSTYETIEAIAEADNELIASIAAEKQQIESAKTELEASKTQIEAAKAKKEAKSQELANNKASKDAKLNQLSKDQSAAEKQLKEYEAEERKMQEAARKAAEEAAKNQGNNGSNNYTGGILAWPVPGKTTISSEFGMRWHPVTGGYKMHKGIDIKATSSDYFVAAEDGTVIKVNTDSWGGRMG